MTRPRTLSDGTRSSVESHAQSNALSLFERFMEQGYRTRTTNHSVCDRTNHERARIDTSTKIRYECSRTAGPNGTYLTAQPPFLGKSRVDEHAASRRNRRYPLRIGSPPSLTAIVVPSLLLLIYPLETFRINGSMFLAAMAVLERASIFRSKLRTIRTRMAATRSHLNAIEHRSVSLVLVDRSRAVLALALPQCISNDSRNWRMGTATGPVLYYFLLNSVSRSPAISFERCTESNLVPLKRTRVFDSVAVSGSVSRVKHASKFRRSDFDRCPN